MKRSFSLFISLLALAGFLLAACSVPVPTATQEKPGNDQAEVEFIGKIESIQDNQWTINGQVVEVSAELVKELTFQVGDEVKVKVVIDKDGLVKAQSIEKPGEDSGNSNDDNSNDDNGNDDNSHGNTNDDNSNINGNANTNSNINDNSNGNANSNINTNSNTNSNGNSNSNANYNTNSNTNSNKNQNSNDNDDDKGNDNDDDNDDDDD